MDWLKLGEETSTLFYNGIKTRKVGNSIFVLKNADGEINDSKDNITAEIIDFYVALFGTEVPSVGIDFQNYGGMVVGNSTHDMFGQNPTMDIIKKAILDIGNNKAPEPDGFGSLFFKDYWDLIKGDVANAIDEFFNSGCLLRQFNTTFMSLIPKFDKPFFVKEFRPISCCNVFLKIISKNLVQKVRPLLDAIIFVNQGAFVPGRNISHNATVAQELVKSYERKGISP